MKRSCGAAAFAAATIVALAGCGSDQSPGRLLDLEPAPPGERVIAFASDRGRSTGLTDVYLYSLDTPGYLPLPGLNASGAVERNPALGGDAAVLFFETDRNGNADVLAYDLARKELVALPFVNTFQPETDPAPAADGQHLAFVRRFNGYRRIQMGSTGRPT